MTDYSPTDFLRLADAAYKNAVAIDGLKPVKNLNVDANGNPLSIDFYNPATGYVYDSDTAFQAVLYSNGKKGTQQTFVISYRGTVLPPGGTLHDAFLTLKEKKNWGQSGIPRRVGYARAVRTLAEARDGPARPVFCPISPCM